MLNKQYQYRFSIQFNPANEKHKRACEILNNIGWSKAGYIAKAICHYEDSKESSISKDEILGIIAAINNHKKEEPIPNDSVSPNDNSVLTDENKDTISQAFLAFRKQK